MRVVDLRAMKRQATRHRRLQVATLATSGLLVGLAFTVPLLSARMSVIKTIWLLLAAAALVPLLLTVLSLARLRTRRRVLAAADAPVAPQRPIDFDQAWLEARQ